MQVVADAISRLETMVLMANLNLPEKAIRKQIASAITLVLQMHDSATGSRLTHIRDHRDGRRCGLDAGCVRVEKQGVSPEGRTLGTFTATGVRPKFEEKLGAAGISLPPDFFDPAVPYRRRQR